MAVMWAPFAARQAHLLGVDTVLSSAATSDSRLGRGRARSSLGHRAPWHLPAAL